MCTAVKKFIGRNERENGNREQAGRAFRESGGKAETVDLTFF